MIYIMSTSVTVISPANDTYAAFQSQYIREPRVLQDVSQRETRRARCRITLRRYFRLNLGDYHPMVRGRRMVLQEYLTLSLVAKLNCALLRDSMLITNGPNTVTMADTAIVKFKFACYLDALYVPRDVVVSL